MTTSGAGMRYVISLNRAQLNDTKKTASNYTEIHLLNCFVYVMCDTITLFMAIRSPPYSAILTADRIEFPESCQAHRECVHPPPINEYERCTMPGGLNGHRYSHRVIEPPAACGTDLIATKLH